MRCYRHFNKSGSTHLQIVAFIVSYAYMQLIGPFAVAQEDTVADMIEECDLLAAHPADPERMSEGVPDDMIVPRLAILACEASMAADLVSPRFVFQLGRALLAVGREEEAFARFQEVAEDDYAAAWAYLGDSYQFGLGTSVDGPKAFAAYKRALELGFQEAESQIEQLTFDPALFTLPFPQYFFEGKYPEIGAIVNDADRKSTMRNYVFNFVQSLLVECEPFLKPENVPALYRFRYPPGWTIASDESVAVAIQTSVAEYDAGTFLRRHGCNGLIAKHMFESINRYLSTNP